MRRTMGVWSLKRQAEISDVTAPPAKNHSDITLLIQASCRLPCLVVVGRRGNCSQNLHDWFNQLTRFTIPNAIFSSCVTPPRTLSMSFYLKPRNFGMSNLHFHIPCHASWASGGGEGDDHWSGAATNQTREVEAWNCAKPTRHGLKWTLGFMNHDTRPYIACICHRFRCCEGQSACFTVVLLHSDDWFQDWDDWTWISKMFWWSMCWWFDLCHLPHFGPLQQRGTGTSGS